MRNEFKFFALIAPLITAGIAWFLWPSFWWAFLFLGPIILMGLYDMYQTRHAILRT